jgi:hypothetical protein
MSSVADRAVGVLVEEVAHGGEELVVADDAAQLGEQPGGPTVGAAGVLLRGREGGVADRLAGGGVVEVAEQDAAVALVLGAAQGLGLQHAGEALLDPHVVPGGDGDEVAPPLMGELVGGEVVVALEARLVARGLALEADAGVLDAAADRGEEDQLVLLERVGAELRLVDVEHAIELADDARSRSPSRPGRCHTPIGTSPWVLVLRGERADGERHEVGREGVVGGPAHAAGVAVPLVELEPAVADQRLVVAHAQLDGEAGAVVGAVLDQGIQRGTSSGSEKV